MTVFFSTAPGASVLLEPLLERLAVGGADGEHVDVEHRRDEPRLVGGDVQLL